MKLSLPTAGRHDGIVKHWDDHHGDLPTAGRDSIPTFGTGQVPEGSGQVMATEKQL